MMRPPSRQAELAELYAREVTPRADECMVGHALTADNVIYVLRGADGHHKRLISRKCLTCHRAASMRTYYRRTKRRPKRP